MNIGLLQSQNQFAALNLDRRLMEAKNLKSGIQKANDNEKIKEKCQDFESIFVNMMLKQMRKTVTSSGFLGTSHSEKVFQEMLDEEMSKEISKSQGLGIAKMMYNQLEVKL